LLHWCWWLVCQLLWAVVVASRLVLLVAVRPLVPELLVVHLLPRPKLRPLQPMLLPRLPLLLKATSRLTRLHPLPLLLKAKSPLTLPLQPLLLLKALPRLLMHRKLNDLDHRSIP
jgi:hypothetical protein